MVYDFYSSRYAACLARLARLLHVLRLDLHLSPHVDALYSQAWCTSAVGLFDCGWTSIMPTSLWLWRTEGTRGVLQNDHKGIRSLQRNVQT